MKRVAIYTCHIHNTYKVLKVLNCLLLFKSYIYHSIYSETLLRKFWKFQENPTS
jgi:hypothetical protein